MIVDARTRAGPFIPHQLYYQLALSKFALLFFRKVRIYAAMPAGKYKARTYSSSNVKEAKIYVKEGICKYNIDVCPQCSV